MASGIPFTEYEAVLLLEAYFESVRRSKNRQEILSNLSEDLRCLALAQNEQIDESFRSVDGLGPRLLSMESAFVGHTVTVPATKLFVDTVNMFKHDKMRYCTLLAEAKCGINKIKNRKTDENAGTFKPVISGASNTTVKTALSDDEKNLQIALYRACLKNERGITAFQLYLDIDKTIPLHTIMDTLATAAWAKKNLNWYVYSGEPIIVEKGPNVEKVDPVVGGTGGAEPSTGKTSENGNTTENTDNGETKSGVDQFGDPSVFKPKRARKMADYPRLNEFDEFLKNDMKFSTAKRQKTFEALDAVEVYIVKHQQKSVIGAEQNEILHNVKTLLNSMDFILADLLKKHLWMDSLNLFTTFIARNKGQVERPKVLLPELLKFALVREKLIDAGYKTIDEVKKMQLLQFMNEQNIYDSRKRIAVFIRTKAAER